jgi:sugar phosphate isomerase/epimerase
MRFGCCLGLATFLPEQKEARLLSEDSIEETISSRFRILERNGFDYVEAEVALLMDEENGTGFSKFKKAVSGSSLTTEVFSGFVPSYLRIVGSNVQQTKIRQFLSTAIGRVAEVGGEIIIWGSGASRTYPAGFLKSDAYKQIESFLKTSAEIARKYGLQIAIEHMNRRESNTINTVEEALEVAKRLDKPEIKLMVDFFHLMEEHENLSVVRETSQYLVHVHISDSSRSCPGTGRYPIRNMLRSLKEAGYDDRVSLECVYTDFARETADGLKLLKSTWTSLGE